MMVTRGRQHDQWLLGINRAAQAAIGQQLKTVYEPPKELTARLGVLVTAMDKPEEDRD
jgi:hypothetical protein